MKSHVRAAVIGGGVVGCSVLYHLTRAGWRDVVLIERSELTSGSTWHAAGGFHTLNADTNMAALQGYTITLYRELEALSGQSCGLHHVGGLTIATTGERLDFLRAERAKHRYMGLDTEIVGPAEIRSLSPITNVEGVLGALYDPLDGHLDPSGTTQAYAKAARANGAEIYLRNRVLELHPKVGRRLGGGHRAGHPGRGARGQRGRALGARGRGDGGDPAPLPADGAPVLRERGHPRGLRARRGAAPRHGPGGRELPAPGRARAGARRLRAGLRGVAAPLHALGLRARAAPRQAGAHGRQAGRRVRALPLPGARRDQAHHQRPLHLRPGRQPAGRPGAGAARLLVRLRGDGGLQPGRRRRARARGVDGRGRALARRVRDGRGALRRLVHPPLHPGQGARELPAPFRHRLPQRGAAGRASAGHHPRLRRVAGAERGLRGGLRARARQLLRPARRARLRGAGLPPLERLRPGRGGVRRGARRARHQRDPQLRQVRARRPGGGGLAVAHHGRARAPGGAHRAHPHAEPPRQADRRLQHRAPRRGALPPHRLLRGPGLPHALVPAPPAAGRGAASRTSRCRASGSRSRGRGLAICSPGSPPPTYPAPPCPFSPRSRPR